MFKKNALTVFFVLSAAILAGCASTAYAQSSRYAVGSEVTRTVTVTGSGKVFLVPDVAYITIGVTTEGETTTKAVAAKDAVVKKVTEALMSKGVDKKDIQATAFSVYPQQEYDENYNPTNKIKYIVHNSIFITLRDIPKAGDVLDAAIKAGAETISDIQFDVEDKTTALSEARQQAVSDAYTRAQELAEASGVKVGEVQTIKETTSLGLQPVPDQSAAGAAAESAPALSQPRQMVLNVEVQIVYEIR